MEILFISIIFLILTLSGLNIDQEYQRTVVFRLGRFRGIKGPGPFWSIPFVDKLKQVDIRTKTIDLKQLTATTKDQISIKVNTLLWYKITTPENAVIRITDYNKALYHFSINTIRNIIAQYLLKETLIEREQINLRIQENINLITKNWGIQVEFIEMKDIEIPEEIQKALSREAEAIIEKKTILIKAEAELEAAIKTKHPRKETEKHPAVPIIKKHQMFSENWY